jgi:hypothetical protein
VVTAARTLWKLSNLFGGVVPLLIGKHTILNVLNPCSGRCSYSTGNETHSTVDIIYLIVFDLCLSTA